MPTHDPHDPTESELFKESEAAGYEVTDVNVNGIVVFLASLGAFVGVFFIFCFGMGKVINTAILKSDGPPNKWNQIGSQPRGKRAGSDLECGDGAEPVESDGAALSYPSSPDRRRQPGDGGNACPGRFTAELLQLGRSSQR